MPRTDDCHFTIDGKLVPHLRATVRNLVGSRKAMPLLREMSQWIRSVNESQIYKHLSVHNLNKSHLSLPPKDGKDDWLIMSQANFSRWLNQDWFNLGNRYTNSVYFFIIVNYPEKLEAVKNQEIMKSREPLVRSLRSVFNHDDDWKSDLIKNFVGAYRLYRPFFLDPAKILVGELRIGMPIYREDHHTPFDACLFYEYADRSGRIRSEVHNGKAVKHGSSVSIFLGNHSEESNKAHFIFYADRYEGNPANSLSGLLIANANTDRKDLASSWPFHAERLKAGEPVVSGTYPISEIDAHVMEELTRGVMSWNPIQSKAPKRKP